MVLKLLKTILFSVDFLSGLFDFKQTLDMKPIYSSQKIKS